MDLKDLYRDVILDHNKRPRNFGVLAPPAIGAKGHNPLCGDQLTVYVDLDHGVIRDVKFEGSGCAISVASASLMTEAVKGLKADAFAALHARVHDVLTRHDAEIPTELGKLAALGGVREYPARVKCASLSWRTLEAALAGAHAVTTE
jgi:nitrogen fixation protein NifU and related proteins